jgi:hypothetical protein
MRCIVNFYNAGVVTCDLKIGSYGFNISSYNASIVVG